MATPLTRAEWLDECAKLAKTYEEAMTDEAKALVDRLRVIPDRHGMMYEDYDDVIKAADLIETQAREIERLRGVLREAEVKLTDVQGAYATKQYSANLLTRIRAALAGDSHD